MVVYLEKVKELIRSFATFSIKVVLRLKNSHVDALAKLASTKDAKLLNHVFVEFLSEPSIKQRPKIMELEQEPSWIDPIGF